MAVFRGFIVNGGSETVVAPLNASPKERQAYSLNKGLDLNGDRRITKEELAMVAFGVGRFGGVQPFAKTRDQNSAPQQKGNTEPTQPRATSRYVAIPASINSRANFSLAELHSTPAVLPKTRSIYIH
jgi:hypothetical protein